MEFPELGTHCAVQSCSRLGMMGLHAAHCLAVLILMLYLSMQISYLLNVMRATRYSGELSACMYILR